MLASQEFDGFACCPGYQHGRLETGKKSSLARLFRTGRSRNDSLLRTIRWTSRRDSFYDRNDGFLLQSSKQGTLGGRNFFPRRLLFLLLFRLGGEGRDYFVVFLAFFEPQPNQSFAGLIED